MKYWVMFSSRTILTAVFACLVFIAPFRSIDACSGNFEVYQPVTEYDHFVRRPSWKGGFRESTRLERLAKELRNDGLQFDMKWNVESSLGDTQHAILVLYRLLTGAQELSGEGRLDLSPKNVPAFRVALNEIPVAGKPATMAQMLPEKYVDAVEHRPSLLFYWYDHVRKDDLRYER